MLCCARRLRAAKFPTPISSNACAFTDKSWVNILQEKKIHIKRSSEQGFFFFSCGRCFLSRMLMFFRPFSRLAFGFPSYFQSRGLRLIRSVSLWMSRCSFKGLNVQAAASGTTLKGQNSASWLKRPLAASLPQRRQKLFSQLLP